MISAPQSNPLRNPFFATVHSTSAACRVFNRPLRTSCLGSLASAALHLLGERSCSLDYLPGSLLPSSGVIATSPRSTLYCQFRSVHLSDHSGPSGHFGPPSLRPTSTELSN